MRYKIRRAPSERLEKGNLTVEEIAGVTREIVKIIQHQEFPKELATLQRFPQELTTSSTVAVPNGKKSIVSYVSPLRKLSPLIHDGVICVGGRLDRASLGLSAKHPMILPSKHHVTGLIISDCHEREGNVGAGQVLASIRHVLDSPRACRCTTCSWEMLEVQAVEHQAL